MLFCQGRWFHGSKNTEMEMITHDSFIANLYAYRFSEKKAAFLYSYLKRWKQNVKVDDILP